MWDPPVEGVMIGLLFHSRGTFRPECVPKRCRAWEPLCIPKAEIVCTNESLVRIQESPHNRLLEAFTPASIALITATSNLVPHANKSVGAVSYRIEGPPPSTQQEEINPVVAYASGSWSR